MVNLTGAQGISIILSDERFSCFEGRTEGFEQTLDTQTGIYARRLEWTSPRGRKTVLAFQGLASFDLPQLAIINIEITPINWSGDIRIVSSLNADVTQDFDPNGPRKAHHVKKLLDTVFLSARGGTLAAQIKARGSGLTAACAVSHSWEGGFVQEETRAGSECAESVLAAQAVRGEPLRLSKYCVYKDSRRFQEPLSAVMELLEGAVLRTFPSWASRQEEFLGRFREETRCGIEGNDLLDTSLDYSAFCLLSSAGMDGVGNVSSKGLSGERYEGHYFWDTEIYVFPFFLLPRPPAARKHLERRALMLDEARLHAREMGHPHGALYAWRTIAGAECSSYFPSGSAQYHLNGAIAHAFLDYWDATGDLAFMEKTGLPVLLETARLWMDAGHWHEGAFRIDSVTGPDEYSCAVNNNYYAVCCACRTPCKTPERTGRYWVLSRGNRRRFQGRRRECTCRSTPSLAFWRRTTPSCEKRAGPGLRPPGTFPLADALPPAVPVPPSDLQTGERRAGHDVVWERHADGRDAQDLRIL